MEDLAAEKRFQPVLLATGDEDLTAGDAVEDKFLPAGVQLGEHIVEQEDGRKARQLVENVALGEFEEERRALMNRLSRIEGQIRGIRGMLERDAYCADILTQSAAVSAAMNGFNRALLNAHLHNCVVRDIRAGDDSVVDELVRAIKARHVARLQAGSCSIEYGFVLEDLLTNYERVCDHCSNVAVAQIEVAQDSFDTHAYLNDLRSGHASTKESEQFQRRLNRFSFALRSQPMHAPEQTTQDQ